MKEMAMKETGVRSRIAVLVVAALVSVSGAFGTAAFLTADEANAAGTYYYCWKDSYGVWKCAWRA